MKAFIVERFFEEGKPFREVITPLSENSVYIQFDQEDGLSIRIYQEHDTVMLRTNNGTLLPIQSSGNLVAVHCLMWDAIINVRTWQNKWMRALKGIKKKISKESKRGKKS